MSSDTQNIFDSMVQEPVSKLQLITDFTKDVGVSLLKRIQQILSGIHISEETTVRITQNLSKTKEFIKENKEVVLGITLIAGLYVANERRSQKIRNSKSKHIYSLTTNPNSALKRSGSHKPETTQQQQQTEGQKSQTQKKLKKQPVPKLHYLRGFISEAEEEQESFVRSDEEEKQNPDLSTSTRRTESMVSDIECMKKKRRKNLEPILDLVEEEEQTQDRVFFEMFRTYRES